MKRYFMEKLRPVVLPRERACDEQASLTEKEVSLLRGMGGSLLWIGKEARPDVGAACSIVYELGQGWAPHCPYQTGQ